MMTTLEPKQEELQALIKAGFVKPSDFALDISSKKLYTDKQRYWVDKLVNEGNVAKDAVKPVIKKASSLQSVVDLVLSKVSPKLLYPRISMLTDTNNEYLELKLAKKDSRNPGCVYVKHSRRGYLGLITPDGRYVPRHGDQSGVSEAINKFMANPYAGVRAFGRAKGFCCFCHLSLDDPRSTGMGYGPVCAKRMGLPWGDWEKLAAGIAESLAPDWRPLETTPEDFYA